MPSTELLLPFIAATFVFAYFPGPAVFYTAAQTLARGRKGGMFAALGLHIGCYAHVVAAAFGLSAIFVHVPEAYMVMKWVGAAYLIWLGLSIVRTKTETALPDLPPRNAWRAFGESMLVEILNPKAAIFFIAFLPQFVDPNAEWPLWVQFLVLGTFVNFAFSTADVITVFLTERLVRALKTSGVGFRIAKGASAGTMIGLGAHLAFSRAL